VENLNVIERACSILACRSAAQKAEAALAMRQYWETSAKEYLDCSSCAPDHPGRPDTPQLVAPSDVPRRRLGTSEGRGALLHAVAHIELNAIDLAADMIARFAPHPLLRGTLQSKFIEDWTRVCAEEAKHYLLLAKRLGELGLTYGDLPAHNGLWEAAHNTRFDIAARLAIAPMVLEARGLDVTPSMIKKLTNVGDMDSVAVLNVIYEEEVGHVKIGAFWFQTVAELQNKSLVGTHFAGKLKPPFNVQARTLAGLTQDYYEPLADY
jgi:uncharacterized ferritin-like protein (DUF455 family)